MARTPPPRPAPRPAGSLIGDGMDQEALATVYAAAFVAGQPVTDLMIALDMARLAVRHFHDTLHEPAEAREAPDGTL